MGGRGPVCDCTPRKQISKGESLEKENLILALSAKWHSSFGVVERWRYRTTMFPIKPTTQQKQKEQGE